MHYFHFASSKVKDLLKKRSVLFTWPESHSPRDSMTQLHFGVSFLFQHYPVDQWKTWSMNTDQETS